MIKNLDFLDIIVRDLVWFGFAPLITFFVLVILFFLVSKCVSTQQEIKIEKENEIKIYNDLYSMPTNPLMS